jgi:O-succinylbenzoic acid--CoA ligase
MKAALESGAARLALIDGPDQVSFERLLDRAQRIELSPRPKLTATIEGLLPLYAALAQRHPLNLTESDPDGRERAAIWIMTSGTAAQARAVGLTEDALTYAAGASAERLGWRDDDRWMVCLPVHRIGGLSILVRCLLAHKPAVLQSHFAPLEAIETIAQQRVTLLSLVPAMVDQLLDAQPAWMPPAHLRAVLVGGDACPATLLTKARERGLPLLPTYGMTETAAQVATVPPGTPPDAAHGVGPALAGYELRIAADQVIELRTPALACDLPRTADGWYRTADRGRLDARGWLHPLGRVDDVIVSGGIKLDPLTIEAQLERLPGIVRAFVFGVPDARWGQLIAAAVVTNDEQIASKIRRELEPTCRPRRLAVVDTLVFTSFGKLDRRAAAARFAPLLVEL